MIDDATRAKFVAWFINRMESVIKTTGNFIQIAKVLTELYPVYPSDWEEDQVVITHIIESKEIRKLSKQTFKCYLEKYSGWDAMDIMDSQTYLGKLYKVFTIAVDYSSYDDESCMENLVIDEAIAYFSQHKSQRYKECSNYFRLTEEEERLGYADEMLQDKEEKKIALFGSNTGKYEEFLNQCFVQLSGQDYNQNTTGK